MFLRLLRMCLHVLMLLCYYAYVLMLTCDYAEMKREPMPVCITCKRQAREIFLASDY